MKKYSINCRSTGTDCDFEIRNASSIEELLEELDAHARRVHGFSLSEADERTLEELVKKVVVTGK